MKLAVISDTHGLLRESVLSGIQHADLILHGGDVGSPEIIERLKEIAPVHAIRGNTDHGEFGRSLPSTDTIDLGGGLIYMVHDIADLDIDPAKAGVRLVIYGHSHEPAFSEEKDVCYLNPGSIGPRRFHLPISYAVVDWNNGSFSHEFVTLRE